MSLRAEQSAFVQDLVALINYAWQLNYDVVLGEVERTAEQQKIYVETGRSKTMNSNHLRRLAADVHIFDRATGEYVLDEERLSPLGKYWESLHPKNRWGGNFDRDWGSSDNFKDRPHF